DNRNNVVFRNIDMFDGFVEQFLFRFAGHDGLLFSKTMHQIKKPPRPATVCSRNRTTAIAGRGGFN
ncbi:MAG: hypothetical protein ABSF29_14585, partial [Tepidisphaeraceae bacterium]